MANQSDQLNRQSSFAREFFEAGGDHPALSYSISVDSPPAVAATAGAAAAAAVSSSPSNSVRRRRLSHETEVVSAHNLPRPELAQRKESWFQDALTQGGMTEENMESWLQSSTAKPLQTGGTSLVSPEDGLTDDEVVEQYRILALHEARQIVKDKLGVDVDELRERIEVRKKISDEEIVQVQGPDILLEDENSDEPYVVSIQATPPPTLEWNPSQRLRPREPQLQVGRKDGVHGVKVKCLGCRQELRVTRSATLVSCPDCSTVGPATAVQ